MNVFGRELAKYGVEKKELEIKAQEITITWELDY